MLIKFKCYTEEGKEKEFREGWNKRKGLNIVLATSYKKLKWKVADRVSECAKVVVYKVFEDGSKSIDKVFFCKDKLCPVCNRRRAVKHRIRATDIITKFMEKEPNAVFLFCTFTIKNVDADELGNAMSKLVKAYTKLQKRARVSKVVLGSLRATEVTRNKETGQYHPHIHAIIAIKTTYFKGSTYITHKEWLQLWKDCLDINYNPVVNIKRIKPKEEDGSLTSAVVETVKYPVKSDDYDLEDTEIVSELREGLFRKRQLAYTGKFKEIDNELTEENKEDREKKKMIGTLLSVWDNTSKRYKWSDEEPSEGL